jgi:transposase-like protein
VSYPEIALHKKSKVMKEIKKECVKRRQKDYRMAFKLSVVSEIERGEISVTSAKKKYGVQGYRTITNWLRKYGTFDWENQTPSNMPKSKDQQILELKQQVKLNH